MLLLLGFYSPETTDMTKSTSDLILITGGLGAGARFNLADGVFTRAFTSKRNKRTPARIYSSDVAEVILLNPDGKIQSRELIGEDIAEENINIILGRLPGAPISENIVSIEFTSGIHAIALASNAGLEALRLAKETNRLSCRSNSDQSAAECMINIPEQIRRFRLRLMFSSVCSILMAGLLVYSGIDAAKGTAAALAFVYTAYSLYGLKVLKGFDKCWSVKYLCVCTTALAACAASILL